MLIYKKFNQIVICMYVNLCSTPPLSLLALLSKKIIDLTDNNSVVVVVVVHYFNLRGTRKKKDIQTIKINVMIYNRKALATTK